MNVTAKAVAGKLPNLVCVRGRRARAGGRTALACATCPAPRGFPANYLGALNMSTGHITLVTTRGATLEPQGMIFVSP